MTKTKRAKIPTAKELLALPRRQWDVKSVYDGIYLVPTKDIHDSGYRLIAVVGERGKKPVEIAAFCDVISWEDDSGIVRTDNLRMDMQTNNIVHVWSSHGRMEVGIAVSSLEIKWIWPAGGLPVKVKKQPGK